MKKIIAILLAVLFLIPSPVFAREYPFDKNPQKIKYPFDKTPQEIKYYCTPNSKLENAVESVGRTIDAYFHAATSRLFNLRHSEAWTDPDQEYNDKMTRNATLCDFHKKFGRAKNLAWKEYQDALDYPEWTPEWNMTPAQLLKEYDDVKKHIAFMWSQNEEIVYAQLDRGIRDVLTTIAVTAIASIIGSYVGPWLMGADMPLAGTIAEVIPNASARVSFGSMIRQIPARLGKGVFYADLGVTMVVLAADGLLVSETFHFAREAQAELEKLLSVNKTYRNALQDKEKLEAIMGKRLSQAQQQEIEQNRDQIKDALDMTRAAVSQEQSWGKYAEMAFKHQEIKNLYALRYIRAEMADLSDGLRFRTAVYDLSSVLQQLPLQDNQELRKMVEDAWYEAVGRGRKEFNDRVWEELKRKGYSKESVMRGNCPPLSRTFQ